jgi:hypothetical protein
MLSPKTLLARSLQMQRAVTTAASVRAGPRCLSSLVASSSSYRHPLQQQQQQPARAFSWDTSNPESLFKLTSQALIHDISLHQMETVKTVVPWFLNNMPVSE